MDTLQPPPQDEEPTENLLITKIQKSGAVQGRSEEVQRLRDLAKSLSENNSETRDGACQTVLVHGPSGSGKTSLCRDVANRFPSYLHLFGKFEQYNANSSAPYAALVQALTSLLVQDNDEEPKRGGTPVLEAALKSLRTDSRALCELVPAFASLTNDAEVDDDAVDGAGFFPGREDKMMMPAERLAISVVCLLQSVCSMQHPAFLIMDDLQWADENSLSVLRAIALCRDLPNLLLIGIYRDSDDHKENNNGGTAVPLLSAFLQAVVQDNPNAHDIAMANLDQNQVSSMVLELLSLEPTPQSTELITLINRKTLGNPHFIVQFLIMLQRRQLLKFNCATMKWQWDNKQIQDLTLVEYNVVALLSRRLQDLPSSLLRVLQIASCLGFLFDSELLSRLLQEASATAILGNQAGQTEDGERVSSFDQLMEQAVAENLLEASGAKHHRFTHDKIQQTIYEMVSDESARAKTHWIIGKQTKALIAKEPQARARFLLMTTNQLNRGSQCVETDAERIELMMMNYEASLLAKQRNGSHLVGLFLNQALQLAQDSDWDASYELLINIHNTMAEYEASRDQPDEAIAHTEIVLQRARNPKDTVIALAARSTVHTNLMNFDQAVEDARNAVAVCGERLPSSNMLAVLRELLRAKRALRSKSDKELLDLPEMSDPLKKHAMKVLSTCIILGWQHDPPLLPLAGLRMVRTTLQFGRTRHTGLSYVALGMILAGTGDAESAYRYTKLGLQAQSPEETGPDLITFAYVSTMHTKLPIASMVEPCLVGYRKGLETGETFHGSTCLVIYVQAYLISGHRLDSLAADLRKFAGQLKVLCHDLQLLWMLPHFQFALNMSGASKNPFEITWDTLSKHGLMSDHTRLEDSSTNVLNRDYAQLHNSFILRDEETAATTMQRMMKLRQSERNFDGNHFSNYLLNFLFGMVGFWLGKKQRNAKLVQFARKAIKWFRKRQNVNTLPLTLLLEAQESQWPTPQNWMR